MSSPAGLTNTSSSSNLVFPGGFSHPGTDQAQPCLASVGNQSWLQGDMAVALLSVLLYHLLYCNDGFLLFCTLVLSHITACTLPWRQNVMSPPTINFTKQSQKSGKHAVRSQTIKGINVSVRKKRSIQAVENKNLSQRQVSQI